VRCSHRSRCHVSQSKEQPDVRSVILRLALYLALLRVISAIQPGAHGFEPKLIKLSRCS